MVERWRETGAGEKKRKEKALPVLRANSIFDWPASRHSRLRQGSKIDYSSITLRLVSSPPFLLIHRGSASLLVPLRSPHPGGPLPHYPARLTGPKAPPTSLAPRDPHHAAPVCSTRGLSRPDLRASRLHVACPNDVSERTGTTAI